jgi:hypothetical protein
MRHLLIALIITPLAGAALAKLPPLSDEAKAKAAEAAGKTAHSGKVANYQLCRSMEKVAARYLSEATKAGKTVNKPTETPACADPGPFVPTGSTPTTPSAPAPAKKS